MELLGEEWKWEVVGLSEVVRLAKLLLAAHFSDLLIYLIHFRSIILLCKLYRHIREY